MADQAKSSKNLIIVGVFVAAIAIAAYMYIGRDTSADDGLLVSSAGSPAAPVDTQLLAALRDLQRLSLNADIFSDPVWRSLVDFSKPIAPQEKYRPNPFAPIGSGNTASQPTGQGTSTQQ